MSRKLILSLGFVTALAVPLSAPQAKDTASQAFIKKAIEGNLSEVSLGQLGQQKAASEDVRNFARQLETDHSSANEKAVTAAGSVNVTPPTEPPKAKRAVYDKLSKLSGDAFDRQFVQSMIADHKKDIAEYQKEAKRQDAAGSYASESLPVLQKHLETAQSLAKAKTQ
jgi:putative membrane protein